MQIKRIWFTFKTRQEWRKIGFIIVDELVRFLLKLLLNMLWPFR